MYASNRNSMNKKKNKKQFANFLHMNKLLVDDVLCFVDEGGKLSNGYLSIALQNKMLDIIELFIELGVIPNASHLNVALRTNDVRVVRSITDAGVFTNEDNIAVAIARDNLYILSHLEMKGVTFTSAHLTVAVKTRSKYAMDYIKYSMNEKQFTDLLQEGKLLVDDVSRFVAEGGQLSNKHLAIALKNRRLDIAEFFLQLGVGPDESHLTIALRNKRLYTDQQHTLPSISTFS
jgi:hypothetical protein